MIDTLYQIIPLFLIILIGSVFGYFHKSFDKNTVSELNKFAYFIGFPCIIIDSFIQIDKIPFEDVKTAGINICILCLFIFLILIITQSFLRDNKLKNTYFICGFFGNVAYLGFPLVQSINPNYATSLSLHIAGYLILLFTIGIIKLEISKNDSTLNYKNLVKTIISNPLLIATFLGIAITLTNPQIPQVANSVIGMIASSASPIVLFALGVFISQNKLPKNSFKHAFAISAIKLFSLPLLFWLFSATLFQNLDLTVSIIIASMPVAITPFVLAEIYSLDKKIIASAIIFSTVLAILSIPFIVNIL